MLTIRIAASALVGLMAVLVAGCDPATSDDLGTSTPTHAPPSTPTPAQARTTTTPPAPSIAGLSVAKILTRTQAAAKAATSVRMKGALSDEAGERMVLDVRLTKTGGQGSITKDGATISIMVIGRTAYLKPSDTFWRQQTRSKAEANAVVGLIGGRWIRTTLSNKDLGALALFASKPQFFDTLFVPTGGGAVRKTAPRTVDGVPSIGLRDGEGILWVDTATARPVRLETPGKTGTDALTFTEYNRVTTPKAPPADDVIDGKDLGM